MTDAGSRVATSSTATPPALLEVEDLRVAYPGSSGPAVAVDGVSFTLEERGSLAILGESGSGKTSLGLALLGLLGGRTAQVSGRVVLDGVDILSLSDAALEDVRGVSISMIFQDPLSSLNPVKRVGDQIGELFRRHRGMSDRDARDAAVEMMRRVRIPDAARRAADHPHQFSGGMRQRVVIAMALALDPRLIIADEPTTALDVTVQAQIVDLLAEVRETSGAGLILISHDLGLAAGLADDLLVLYAGRVAERGSVRDCYEAPAHPYTLGLLGSAPGAAAEGDRLRTIPGSPPRIDQLPPGCAFGPRCAFVMPACLAARPELRSITPDRRAACIRAEDVLAVGG
jgi:oligopeptide transport system ATP-binding protein